MISVILNVYKRPYTLKKQIESILNQSIKVAPEDIHIWYNNSDEIQNFPEDQRIKTYNCSWNTKFWGRFTIPLLCKTKYVAILDDDIFPEKDWLKNCIDTIENPKSNGILGGSGILLPDKGYTRAHTKVGWNGIHSNEAMEVDLVGHAWFFRQEWSKFLWIEKPCTWENGEDIMFSYLCQKYGRIKTFVPPHPEDNKSIWCTNYKDSSTIGSDKVASYRINKDHINQRDACVEYCKSNGWQILKDRSDVKADDKHIISCNMATYPERIDFLKKAVESILPNVDILRIYLNDYKEVPEFLNHEKIQVVIGQENIKALGKYYFLPKEKTNEYYFSCDDDFIYTPSFFNRSIEYLKKNPNHIVGTHGMLIKHSKDKTYKQSYMKKLSAPVSSVEDLETNVIGTGLLCFNCAEMVIPFDSNIFKYNFMIDLCISKYFIDSGVKMIIRAHYDDEILSQFINKAGYRLSEDKTLIQHQIKFLNDYGVVFNKRYDEIISGG